MTRWEGDSLMDYGFWDLEQKLRRATDVKIVDVLLFRLMAR